MDTASPQECRGVIETVIAGGTPFFARNITRLLAPKLVLVNVVDRNGKARNRLLFGRVWDTKKEKYRQKVADQTYREVVIFDGRLLYSDSPSDQAQGSLCWQLEEVKGQPLSDSQYKLLVATMQCTMDTVRECGEAGPLVVIVADELKAFGMISETREHMVRQMLAIGLYARNVDASAIFSVSDVCVGGDTSEGIAAEDDPAHMQAVHGVALVKGHGFYPYELAVPYFRGDQNEILPADEGWKESSTGKFTAHWGPEFEPHGVLAALEEGFGTSSSDSEMAESVRTNLMEIYGTTNPIIMTEDLTELGCYAVPLDRII